MHTDRACPSTDYCKPTPTTTTEPTVLISPLAQQNDNYRSSWIPHPPVKLSRADLEHSHAKVISNSNPVSSHRPTEGSSCHRKSGDGTNSNAHGGDGAELTVSRQRLVVTDEDVDPLPSFADEDVGAAAAAAAGSGGGGGGRVGTFSLPRALPAATNGKAPLNKKFAWVP